MAIGLPMVWPKLALVVNPTTVPSAMIGSPLTGYAICSSVNVHSLRLTPAASCASNASRPQKSPLPMFTRQLSPASQGVVSGVTSVDQYR